MRSDMVEILAIISSSAPEAACTRGPAAQRCPLRSPPASLDSSRGATSRLRCSRWGSVSEGIPYEAQRQLYRYCDWALKGQHLACCLAILSHEAEPVQPVRPKAHCSRGTRMTSMAAEAPCCSPEHAEEVVVVVQGAMNGRGTVQLGGKGRGGGGGSTIWWWRRRFESSI